jgi:ABC-type sugar transport system substrate-binding protein
LPKGITLLPTEWAGGSSWAQIETINALLRRDSRPDGVLIMLAGGLTRGPVERLVKAGCALVLLQRVPDWTSALRAAYPKALVASVAPRQEGIGEIQAAHARRLARPGAFVLLITGDASTPAAIQRSAGFLDAIGSHFTVHMLDGRWTLLDAENVLEQWLQRGAERERSPELVVCHNDAMAAGARKALARHAAASGRGELVAIPLVGCDGLEHEGKRMLTRGELAATVEVPSTAPAAIDLVRRYWDSGARGESVLIECVSLPPLEAAAAPR